MSLLNPFAQPGMSSPAISTENEFTWGPIDRGQLFGVVIVSTATDAGNTPTTTLRRGLVMGQITSSLKVTAYSPTATDGSQIPLGILYEPRNMLDPKTGTAGDQQASILLTGQVKVGSLYGFDENTRRIWGARFVYDDLRAVRGGYAPVVAKTANYTVVNGTDNDTHFTTTGNAGAITFTLPTTIQRGNRWRFTNTVGQNMTVAAAAGKLVAFNNAAATSVTFSTAGNLIGGSFEIVVDDAAAKYLVFPSGANTVTVA